MNYYNPHDPAPRIGGIVAAVIYFGIIASAFWFVEFTRPDPEEQTDTIVVEFAEPAEALDAPHVGDKVEAPAREEAVSNVGNETEEQADTGVEAQEETRTPNPNALFDMSKSGQDTPADVGKRNAKEGEETSAGKGKGSRSEGIEGLDHGLQGRGLVGRLPAPVYPGTKSGKVVIRVQVASDGTVTGASFEQVGSTVNDSALVEAAITAARKARFNRAEAAIQSGTITYIFRLE